MDAGVDLAEFMGGAAEVLRGLLMLQVGARPEGVTEALRATLGSYQGQLESGDVLRMLRLLAENETGIRRSINPRLMVETLLLRWAMLDRIVDLEQVLGQRGGGAAGQGTVSRDIGGSTPGPSLPSEQTASLPRGPAAPPSHGPAAPPSLESVRAAWPAVVAAMRAQSRFLGEAVAAGEPAAFDLPWLTVSLADPNPLFADRLQEEAAKVEEVLGRSLGQPVRLRVTSAVPGETASATKTRRISESSLKAERLREFRAKDPALDTAADALDLEIVD
jgi:DNA polymerase-3 subunit gamma/tau